MSMARGYFGSLGQHAILSKMSNIIGLEFAFMVSNIPMLLNEISRVAYPTLLPKGNPVQIFLLSALLVTSHLEGQVNDSKGLESSESDSAKKIKDKPENSKENPTNDEPAKDKDKTANPAEKPAQEAKDKPSKDDEAKKEEPPKIGNFSLPASQQPAALFGFGGNIIDKDEIQFYFFADDFRGRRKTTSDLIPSILYGITETWTVFFNAPFTPAMRDGHHRSSGLEDFFIQLEYAFYNHSTVDYVDEATLVGNVTFPTGSIHKNPPTGFGSPSLFLGTTYYRTWVDWFAFTAHGAILPGSDHGTKFGDQFLYQFGVGRNFASPEGWIYAWMVELDGQYNKRNRIKGTIDKNSGGNVLYLTPSLWVSSKEILVQWGVSLPLNQNLFGKQHKFDYAINFNFGWSFY